MTEIEQKALALVNEVIQEVSSNTLARLDLYNLAHEAVRRAIEQHEAYKQEVSDAAVKATHTMAAGKLVEASGILAAFIIPKTDPLVEVWDHMIVTGNFGPLAFRAAIEARGGRIVWEGE